MNGMKLEDWLAMGFVGALMLLLLVLGVVALTRSDKVEDLLVVRSPVDQTMLLVTKIPTKPWEFKHCTSTNKECGRLE